MTRHSGETTITKHVHDGLDGGISNLFDEASLPAPNWSWLDHVNLGTGLQAASGSPAVAANTILNHVPATGSPGIGSIWFQSDDSAAAPSLPAAVEAANVPVQAATIPSSATVSNVTTGSDGSISEAVSFSGSNISFSNTFASGVSQAYINCALAAEQAIAAQWSSPNAVTVNESFTALAEGQNGQLASNGFYVFGVSYATLKSALATLASHEPGDAYLQQAVAHLPASDPSGRVGFELALPYARMLGLTSVSNSPDDAGTLNSSYNWSYGQDVISALTHEISEGGLGRIGGLGDQNSLWSVMDLFRYNSSGAADYTDGRDGRTTYVSYNGGATLSSLAYNNEYNGGSKVNDGDTADFTQVDVFGTGFPGETNSLSATDIQLMEALGWSAAPHAVLGNVNIEAHGDFNTDGKPDSIWRDSNASMTMWSYDATGQAVDSVGLGQIGFTWSILGSGSYTGASTSQMLVGSTDGTMDLWYVSSGALTGIGFGQVLSGRGYIDSGNFTSNGLNNFLVFNQADHHLYDWWVANNQLQGVDLGADWNGVGYVGKGQFTSNGGTNFLVTNTVDHQLYDWWVSSSGQLQGADLGAVWSTVSLIAVGNFDSNTTNTEFLVQNTADHHLYEWWVTAQGTLAGVDLGANWNNIQLVDSSHFNDQSANNELLVRNTADGHFYEWWISNNQLQGVDLGLSASSSASTSGQTAAANTANVMAPPQAAAQASAASTGTAPGTPTGNSGATSSTSKPSTTSRSSRIFTSRKRTRARLGRPSNRLHIKIGADLMISPDVNDAMTINALASPRLGFPFRIVPDPVRRENSPR